MEKKGIGKIRVCIDF
jgi:hypothetical protein